MQMWLGTQEMPPEHNVCRQGTEVAATSAGARYYFFTDRTAHAWVRRRWPLLSKLYEALPYPVMRSDIFRYMWLYSVGGLYLDLDVRVTAALDVFFDPRRLAATATLAASSQTGRAINGIMLSPPGQPFWLHVLYEWVLTTPLIHDEKTLRRTRVMRGTGPGLIAAVAERGCGRPALFPRAWVIPYNECSFPLVRVPTPILVLDDKGISSWNPLHKPWTIWMPCVFGSTTWKAALPPWARYLVTASLAGGGVLIIVLATSAWNKRRPYRAKK